VIEIVRYDPDIKRLRTFIDRTDDIQFYTANNLYPQIVEAIRDRSFTIKSACGELGNFIQGDGFEDTSFADLIVNHKGQTMNDILSLIKVDAASFTGSFVIHLGVNLLGEYNNISVWPLSYWRFGLPDDDGDVHDLKYNSNWEADPYKELHNWKKIFTYPKFNPDPEVIKEQIAEYAERGEDYPGQVLYVSPLEDQYPLATFDSVLDQGQTQEEIGMFRLSSIQNGLNATAIFSYPGKFEDETKAKQFKRSINEFKGGAGGGFMVVEDESGQKKAADLITPLTLPNNDKLHEFISTDNKMAIVEAFSMPKGILGILPESGMFNQQQLAEEYVYYNAKTRHYRKRIAAAFKKVFGNWHQSSPENTNIKELQYGNGVTTAQPAAAPAPQAAIVNDNLKNLTGKQYQGIQRIIRDFNREKLTFQQAASALKQGFAFTDADVQDWLVTDAA
jgi:hypothetical protein